MLHWKLQRQVSGEDSRRLPASRASSLRLYLRSPSGPCGADLRKAKNPSTNGCHMWHGDRGVVPASAARSKTKLYSSAGTSLHNRLTTLVAMEDTGESDGTAIPKMHETDPRKGTEPNRLCQIVEPDQGAKLEKFRVIEQTDNINASLTRKLHSSAAHPHTRGDWPLETRVQTWECSETPGHAPSAGRSALYLMAGAGSEGISTALVIFQIIYPNTRNLAHEQTFSSHKLEAVTGRCTMSLWYACCNSCQTDETPILSTTTVWYSLHSMSRQPTSGDPASQKIDEVLQGNHSDLDLLSHYLGALGVISDLSSDGCGQLLGDILVVRSQQQGSPLLIRLKEGTLDDIHLANDNFAAALSLCPFEHPARDAEHAIKQYQTVVDLSYPHERLAPLNNPADVLQFRFQQFHELVNPPALLSEEGSEADKKLMLLCCGLQQQLCVHPVILRNIASALEIYFRQYEDPNELSRYIAYYREAPHRAVLAPFTFTAIHSKERMEDIDLLRKVLPLTPMTCITGTNAMYKHSIEAQLRDSLFELHFPLNDKTMSLLEIAQTLAKVERLPEFAVSHRSSGMEGHDTMHFHALHMVGFQSVFDTGLWIKRSCGG
ncbi:uncharacterized protein HD556DRAFT_1537189 [Suillus plorans]|uniref:Uncharacterized protein n=1 Tax=Suillus plorans TaxID=116603 RepID=A0A9P7ALW8_9AGAM|nr:uncharacterized protein HD556DRAFT_1537189 [Suillus plorans]KAG1791912.1 hypothetical protein HD556DRAFT_1537189 [Suillus plorans]